MNIQCMTIVHIRYYKMLQEDRARMFNGYLDDSAILHV